jgi:hypothetical protein
MMILTLVGLLACKDKNGSDSNGGDVDADTDADADTDTDTDSDTDACTAKVTTVTPADGATDVPVDTVLLALFSAPAESATITVTDGTSAVAGTTALQGDGSSATFTPDSDLDRDTSYAVDVAVCDSSWSGSFSTLPVGIDATDVEGRTYDFDLAEATWVDPSYGGTLVEFFAANHMLIMVEDVDEVAVTLDVLGSAGWEPSTGTVEQYPCSDVADFTAADFSDNPAFNLGPEVFDLAGDGFDVTIHDVVLSGRFSADGSAIENAHVEGLVDLRNLSAGKADACTFVEALGGDCVACPDSVEQCLESTLEWASAPAVSGLTLDPSPSGKGC